MVALALEFVCEGKCFIPDPRYNQIWNYLKALSPISPFLKIAALGFESPHEVLGPFGEYNELSLQQRIVDGVKPNSFISGAACDLCVESPHQLDFHLTINSFLSTSPPDLDSRTCIQKR